MQSSACALASVLASIYGLVLIRHEGVLTASFQFVQIICSLLHHISAFGSMW
jgi:hypothetical protein